MLKDYVITYSIIHRCIYNYLILTNYLIYHFQEVFLTWDPPRVNKKKCGVISYIIQYKRDGESDDTKVIFQLLIINNRNYYNNYY